MRGERENGKREERGGIEIGGKRERQCARQIEKGCEGESGRELTILRGYDMDGEETRGSTDTYVCKYYLPTSSMEGCGGGGIHPP